VTSLPAVQGEIVPGTGSGAINGKFLYVNNLDLAAGAKPLARKLAVLNEDGEAYCPEQLSFLHTASVLVSYYHCDTCLGQIN